MNLLVVDDDEETPTNRSTKSCWKQRVDAVVVVGNGTGGDVLCCDE